MIRLFQFMPDVLDPSLTRTLQADRINLEETELPIITVSGTFREDIKKWHGLRNNNTTPDIVFSRAHFSMALAIATQVWKKKVQPEKAWIVDPTNYVTRDNWLSIRLTDTIGKTIARNSFLKIAKDFVDRFGRSKMPILDSITPPLQYITQQVEKPILSMHIAAGNILAAQGKTVIQVVTDPHVRPEYVERADLATMHYCVFDEATRIDLLEKAELYDKPLDPARVAVTGPPIDPRIVAAAKKKQSWRSGKLRLCITTGGLGTNKTEILALLKELIPAITLRKLPLQLLVYAGTHRDISQAVVELANEHSLPVSPLAQDSAPLRVIYHPQIVDANELLILHGFPWAHGFVTKPSGDMAYDAAAAGCFLLTLKEWGEWEHNVRQVFEQLDISRRVLNDDFIGQINVLTAAQGRSQSWVEAAGHRAHSLPPLFTHGAENIVAFYKEVTKNVQALT